MYNYDFTNNKEKIKDEITNVEICFNNAYYLTNIVITNKNLLIFYDMNRDNVLKARGVQVLPDMNAIIRIPKKELKTRYDDINSYIKYQNSEVILYGINLEDYIESGIF